VIHFHLHRIARISTVIVVALALAVAPSFTGRTSASTNTLYVGPNPSGSGSCLSPDFSTVTFGEGGAIQEAINEANRNPNYRVIVICAGTYTLTSTLEFAYDHRPIELRGEGADATIVDGDENYRIIDANGFDGGGEPGPRSLELTIRDIGLTKAYSPGYGGAIWYNGRLNLIGVKMYDNVADDGGSAIDNDGNGDEIEDVLYIKDSSIYDNSSLGDGGQGGAVLMNGGTVTTENSTFTNNDVGGVAVGGAIYAATVTVRDSTLEGNDAYGGGAISATGRLSVSGSTFTNNLASEDGGAILLQEATRSRISNSEFDGNSTDQYGGAIYAVGTDLDVLRSTFNNNASLSDDGGAIGFTGAGTSGTLNIQSSTFTNNFAALNGGALYLYDAARVRISTSTFGDPDDLDEGNESEQNGGDIYSSVGRLPTYLSRLKILNSEFYGGSAAKDGGSMSLNCTSASLVGVTVADASGGDDLARLGDGGGILARGDGCITPFNISIKASTFLRNASANQGGALASNQGGEDVDDAFDGFKITNSTFEANAADGGAAINVDGERTVSIKASTFIGNEAGDGGALELCGPTVVINRSRFEGNIATRLSGAIQASCDDGALMITRSQFIANESGSNVGAVNLGVYDSRLTSNLFLNNHAAESGGAIGATIVGISDTEYFGRWRANVFDGNTAGLAARHFWINYDLLGEASSETELLRILTRGAADISPQTDWLVQY
jgi:predicted outer membrane repeat protein